MGLSRFAAQGGQSHFRGEYVNSLVTSFPPRKSGQSPVNGYFFPNRQSFERQPSYETGPPISRHDAGVAGGLLGSPRGGDFPFDADTMRAALHTATPEEDGFIDKVLANVDKGVLPADMVESTFIWARRKTRHKFQYFKAGLIFRRRRRASLCRRPSVARRYSLRPLYAP